MISSLERKGEKPRVTSILLVHLERNVEEKQKRGFHGRSQRMLEGEQRNEAVEESNEIN